MKPDVFFSALGNIREDLAADAIKTDYDKSDPAAMGHNRLPEAVGQPVRKVLVIAASLLLVVIIGSVLFLKWMGLPREGNTLSDTSDTLQQTETAAKPMEDSISAPSVELVSRYGLTLHVPEEYADHFDVDVGSYLFPCPYTDGWPGYEESDGKVIFSNTAFVFSDPDIATGTSGREGLVWCIYAIPTDEYTPINDPASSGIFYDINSRLLGQNEEYAFIFVFPSYARQCNQQSLESVTSYWHHMCQGYEVLKNAVESYGFDISPDWLDNYEQYINLLDEERKNLANQQAGK